MKTTTMIALVALSALFPGTRTAMAQETLRASRMVIGIGTGLFLCWLAFTRV
jgi:hypothetical protein